MYKLCGSTESSLKQSKTRRALKLWCFTSNNPNDNYFKWKILFSIYYINKLILAIRTVFATISVCSTELEFITGTKNTDHGRCNEAFWYLKNMCIRKVVKYLTQMSRKRLSYYQICFMYVWIYYNCICPIFHFILAMLTYVHQSNKS